MKTEYLLVIAKWESPDDLENGNWSISHTETAIGLNSTLVIEDWYDAQNEPGLFIYECRPTE